MVKLLVGPRGTGKSSFLKRCQEYYQRRGRSVVAIDLDQYIEQSQNESIDKIFANRGESVFRQLEQDCLREIIEKYATEKSQVPASIYDQLSTADLIVALGAGYKGWLPLHTEVILVRRPTDSKGRVFLDRPRLRKGVSPWQESLDLLRERSTYYEKISTEEFILQEGFDIPSEVEEIFLGLMSDDVGGGLTVLAKNLSSEELTQNFFRKRLSWNLNFFELRSDLLDLDQFKRVLDIVPAEKILASWRGEGGKVSQRDFFEIIEAKKLRWDWGLDFGDPIGQPDILSTHGWRTDSNIFDEIHLLEKHSRRDSSHLKLAPMVETWEDLKVGHDWWTKDPDHRSFLPCSKSGKWQWYRLLHKDKMAINFWRESEVFLLDQPTLSQWHRFKSENSEGFAAIMGSPVLHSLTPFEQYEFFKMRSMNIVAIDMSEKELTQQNLKFLEQLGLKAAAITAPLKEAAYSLCSRLTLEAQQYKSVNTMVWNKKNWLGHNTDDLGLKELLLDLRSTSVAVWGGGGTFEVVKKILPKSSFYSARTGQLKFGDELKSPEVLIWCVGRDRMRNCLFPPQSWPIRKVIDLNYTDDSPGREAALIYGAHYFSGLKMFLEQAIHQRVFWENEMV